MERFRLLTALKNNPSTRSLTNTWKQCRQEQSSTEVTIMRTGVSAVSSRQMAKLWLWIWKAPAILWLDEAPQRPQPTRFSAKLACLVKARDVHWVLGPTKQTLTCTSRRLTCKTSSRYLTRFDLIAKVYLNRSKSPVSSKLECQALSKCLKFIITCKAKTEWITFSNEVWCKAGSPSLIRAWWATKSGRVGSKVWIDCPEIGIRLKNEFNWQPSSSHEMC